MTTSTQPATSTTTLSSGSPSRLVDPEDLFCPGCGEQVRCAPPEEGSGLDSEPGAEFSHSDRSELCRTPSGQLTEPAEVTR